MQTDCIVSLLEVIVATVVMGSNEAPESWDGGVLSRSLSRELSVEKRITQARLQDL